MSAEWFDTLRDGFGQAERPTPTRDLQPPCRCGWRDEAPHGPAPAEVGPVVDLSGEDVALTVTDRQRTCVSCHHPIRVGAPVVRRYYGGAAFHHWFHIECTKGVHP